jgi:hypothetical protein
VGGVADRRLAPVGGVADRRLAPVGGVADRAPARAGNRVASSLSGAVLARFDRKEDQMVPACKSHSPEQLTLLRWIAGLGAVTAEALAVHGSFTVASARGRLLAAERAGLLVRRRLLAGEPALYALTSHGTRACGVRGLQPCRMSVAGAPHAIACAAAAAALERAYPDHRVMGERELRRAEHEAGAALASASLGHGPGGVALLHRPDLVLWPEDARERLPVAVEVELSVKAPRRLLQICRAWARCRCVAGTLYLAAPEVRRPLARALERAQAAERIALVALDALDGCAAPGRTRAPIARTVPGDA